MPASPLLNSEATILFRPVKVVTPPVLLEA
jgi:hypothetical protein